MTSDTQIDLIRFLVNDERLRFKKLRTVGEAIMAELETPQMAADAVQAAKSHNWICTRQNGSTISIETGQPISQTLMFPATFYHVSWVSSRSKIIEDGLKPQTGGNTSLQRSYPPRLHLAVNMRDAFQFIHHQMKSSPTTTSVRCTIADFDLYKVPFASDWPHYVDDHFEGRGVWIDFDVPASDINLLNAKVWHSLYRAMYPEDF